VRPGMPEPGRRQHDEARVHRFEHVPAEAHALDDAGRVVLDDHIALRRQLLRESEAALGADVQRERALRLIEEGLRRAAAGWVRTAAALDLDHVCAHQAEDAGAGGAGDDPAEVQHTDATEWEAAPLRGLALSRPPATLSQRARGSTFFAL